MCQDMNLHISYLQATEAILFARGKDLENSETFDFDRLIRWFYENIKLLRQIKPANRNLDIYSSDSGPAGRNLS